MSLFGNLNLNQNQSTQPSLFGNTATASQPQQGGGLFQNVGQSKPAGGLFGSTATTTQTPPAGGLFGSTPASQPQQTGGLFGSTPASQPQQNSGVFGSTSNTQSQQGAGGLFGSAAASQPAAGGGMFGSTTPAAQPQQSGGGLFGAANTSQPQQASSLFGGTLGNTQQSQPQQSNSLFGNTLGQNQNQTQNTASSSLFGNAAAAPAKSAFSLFGNNNAQNQQPKATPLFGTSTSAQPAQQTSLFGSSTTNQNTQQSSSLFGTRPGGLTMGQSTNQQQQPQQTVPGVRIDVSNVRGTTRFNDLHEELQKQIEQIDVFIQQQIGIKEQCDAMMPAFEENISNLPNDVGYITSKLDTTELALNNDASAIDQMKGVVRKDADDARLCFRLIETQKLPQQFHYTGMWPSGASTSSPASRDRQSNNAASSTTPADLVPYFASNAAEFKDRLGLYKRNIADIEAHLSTLEASIIQQNQQIMFRRGADGSVRSKDDQVRELAAVLREFENAILGVAEKVGSTREGVSGVVEGSKGGIGAWRGR